MAGEILERLAQNERCFISELNSENHYYDTLLQLSAFNFKAFDLNECSYAFSYLFGEAVAFQSYGEIDDYLSKRPSSLWD